MRVSELVKSFEGIASSPRSEASARASSLPKPVDPVSKHDNGREEHLVSDDERNELDAREPDAMSDVDSYSDSSEISSKARMVASRDKKVHQSQKEQVKGATETKDERLVDIVSSSSSELTDEISFELLLSKEKQESTFDQHHGESNNTLNSQCSELTDEIDFDDTVAHEIDKEFDNTQHESQVENLQVSIHDSQVCSGGGGDSSFRDETTSRISHDHAYSPTLDQKQVTDHHQLCVGQQCKKQNSLLVCDTESVHSTMEDTIRHDEEMNERFVLDTCHVSVEKVPTDEPLEVSVPSPVLEKCIVPKLHNVENTLPNDDNCLAPKSPEKIDDKNVHELIKEMEMSMDERFRRLEATCEQIPLIMEQLQRYANDAKHVPITDFGSENNDQTLPIEFRETSNTTISKMDEILKTTSTESIENDVGIMTSFPDLRAYVHQLETTSTNAIANVLLEESMEADEEVFVDETPFDETAAPLSTSMPSSDASGSKSTELLSKEIESLARGDENSDEDESGASSSSSTSTSSELVESNVVEAPPGEIESPTIDVERNLQSHPLDSVLSNCSSIMAIEVVQPDPSEALQQIATFLDDQHANFDRVCWGYVCGSQCEGDE